MGENDGKINDRKAEILSEKRKLSHSRKHNNNISKSLEN
jgi:hypothetical protein